MSPEAAMGGEKGELSLSFPALRASPLA